MFLFNKKNKNYLYTDDQIEKYKAFISEQLGEYDTIFHEINSPDICLDVIIIPPTKERKYYTLVTMGMGAYKMNIPRELKKKKLEHAELIMYLPATWDINSDKEEDYWPIRLLKEIARSPIKYNMWIGFGHTFSSDLNNTPYTSKSKLCSTMLVSGVNKNNELLELNLDGLGKINFYEMLLLYEEELKYKDKYGIQALISNFSEKDRFPLVNLKRKNYCKEKK